MRMLDVGEKSNLLIEVVRFTRHIGFDLVNAMVVVDRLGSQSLFNRVDNIPRSYEDWTNHETRAGDPVMQHCKRASMPICWDRHTYASAGLDHRWEMQAQHGLRSGVALANHLPEGRHFFIGVDRDGPLPSDQEEATRVVAELQLFAAVAQEVALGLLVPEADGAIALGLTKRELECLRWTMEGKTAWEVGCILSISEQTAVRHLNNATKKLDCVNKHHAVVKALRMGLVR